MNVVVSALPGDGGSAGYADLAIVAPFGVVLLDGASAFEPVDVHPATYVSTLGTSITALLHGQPDIPIADAVAEAIGRTIAKLHLTRGTSPSSTVAVLRARGESVDLYVLGDSPIYYGAGTTTYRLTDERLESVAQPERRRYRERLSAGHGYDDEHRSILSELQQSERRAQNVAGGYWIAAADPKAAAHGLSRTVMREDVEWAALATDGASDFIVHSGSDWSDVAQRSRSKLNALLAHIHDWEEHVDPLGQQLPRAKRHDDKTVVSIPTLF